MVAGGLLHEDELGCRTATEDYVDPDHARKVCSGVLWSLCWCGWWPDQGDQALAAPAVQQQRGRLCIQRVVYGVWHSTLCPALPEFEEEVMAACNMH
jgi:hypothetical protein